MTYNAGRMPSTRHRIVGYDTFRSKSRELSLFYESPSGERFRQVFLAGGVSVRLNRLLLRLLAGSLRGGKRCVAGGCRELPPFSGVRLEVGLRF